MATYVWEVDVLHAPQELSWDYIRVSDESLKNEKLAYTWANSDGTFSVIFQDDREERQCQTLVAAQFLIEMECA